MIWSEHVVKSSEDLLHAFSNVIFWKLLTNLLVLQQISSVELLHHNRKAVVVFEYFNVSDKVH